MSDYVDNIAPEHSRTSCDDDDLYNAAYGLDDFDGRGRCYRCTLLMAQAKARIEDAAAQAAPAADAGLVEALCKVEQALDLIGGVRHGKNVTQDELWQACELLDVVIAAHRAKGVV